MPEGHTLHRIARAHEGFYAGCPVRADSPQGRFAAGAAQIDGQVLDHVEAYGKHLFYLFRECGEQLHIHLGLYGTFREGAPPPPEPKGALRLRLRTDEHWSELRGATAVELLTPVEVDAILARLGPDPLRDDAKPAAFLAVAARSRQPVGGILMDQSKIAGVGNVYRAETLFRAGLDPYRSGRDAGRAALREVWDDVRTLMKAGVRSGRIVTTRPADRSKRGPVDPDQALYVYRRDGLPCRVCGTEIRKAEMAGRNLFWCPCCQPPGPEGPLG